jgi:hypothetical protein
MTPDEKLMQEHALSGKFGPKEPIKIRDINHLHNSLTLQCDLNYLADLLEEILEIDPNVDWLRQMIIPEMDTNGLSRISQVVTKLRWRKNELALKERRSNVYDN